MTWHMTLIGLIALGAVGAGAAEGESSEAETAEESVSLPFSLPTPAGWRTETINFPLSFAPEIDYSGLEELRLAPGMFKEDQDDFWTYAFVWWIEGDVALDAGRLEAELMIYYRGLTESVLRSRGSEPPTFEYQVDLVPATGAGRMRKPNLAGTANTFDPFVTQAGIKLNARIWRLPSRSGYTAIFFELSPQQFNHPIWRDLREIGEGYRLAPSPGD